MKSNLPKISCDAMNSIMQIDHKLMKALMLKGAQGYVIKV